MKCKTISVLFSLLTFSFIYCKYSICVGVWPGPSRCGKTQTRIIFHSNTLKQNNVEPDQDRQQQRQEVVPPYQNPGEHSNNASSGPPSLFLVFLAENQWRMQIVDQSNISIKHYALNSKIIQLKSCNQINQQLSPQTLSRFPFH